MARPPSRRTKETGGCMRLLSRIFGASKFIHDQQSTVISHHKVIQTKFCPKNLYTIFGQNSIHNIQRTQSWNGGWNKKIVSFGMK